MKLSKNLPISLVHHLSPTQPLSPSKLSSYLAKVHKKGMYMHHDPNKNGTIQIVWCFQVDWYKNIEEILILKFSKIMKLGRVLFKGHQLLLKVSHVMGLNIRI